MKEYPKRPWLIMPQKQDQVWKSLIMCFVCFFIGDIDVEAKLFTLLFVYIGYILAIMYSSQVAWEEACDKGIASFYCERGYLESQGFKELHMKGVVKISQAKQDLEKMFDQFNNVREQIVEHFLDIYEYKKIISDKDELYMQEKYADRMNKKVEEVYPNNAKETFELNNILMNIFNEVVNGNFKYINYYSLDSFLKQEFDEMKYKISWSLEYNTFNKRYMYKDVNEMIAVEKERIKNNSSDWQKKQIAENYINSLSKKLEKDTIKIYVNFMTALYGVVYLNTNDLPNQVKKGVNIFNYVQR